MLRPSLQGHAVSALALGRTFNNVYCQNQLSGRTSSDAAFRRRWSIRAGCRAGVPVRGLRGKYGGLSLRRSSNRLAWQLPYSFVRVVNRAITAALLVAFPAGAASADTVKLRGAKYIGDLPTLVADTESFFKSSGLDIEVSYGTSGRDNLSALRRGEIDYALMAMTPFVLDRMDDPTPGGAGDPVILANLTHGAPNIRIIVRKDRMPTDPGPESFEGRRVGVSKGTNAEYLWSLFASFHDIDLGTVELIDLTQQEIVDAFNAGRIDAAVVWEPWDQATQLSDDRDVTTYDSALINFYASRWLLVTILAETDRAGEHAVVLAAYRAAVNWIQKNPKAATRRFMDKWNIDEGDARDVGLENAFFDVTLDWSLFASYRQQLAWGKDAGYPVAGGTGSFLSGIQTGPLRSLSPASVLLPEPAARLPEQEEN